MTLSIIAAASQNNVLGNGGKIPWNIPDDSKFFDDMAKGKVLIMGRRTYDLFDYSKKDQKIILISHNSENINSDTVVFSDINAGIEYCRQNFPDEEILISGGAQIYQLTIDLADKIYLTRIYKDFEGDAFFPEVNEGLWKKVEERCNELEGLKYCFQTFIRNN